MNLEQVVADLIQKIEKRYFGKYRGYVVDNNDDKKLGRLKLTVPSVLGKDVVTGWAMPCLPYGGIDNQGFSFIPEKDSGVWVEFEEGDLEFPIWTGTFWSVPGGKSEIPRKNNPDGKEQKPEDPVSCKIIKTKAGNTIQFEDKEGQEMVFIQNSKHKQRIVMNKEGISISNGDVNSIVMKSDHILFKHGGSEIKLEGGIIRITATTEVEINGGSKVTVRGELIDLNP